VSLDQSARFAHGERVRLVHPGQLSLYEPSNPTNTQVFPNVVQAFFHGSALATLRFAAFNASRTGLCLSGQSSFQYSQRNNDQPLHQRREGMSLTGRGPDDARPEAQHGPGKTVRVHTPGRSSEYQGHAPHASTLGLQAYPGQQPRQTMDRQAKNPQIRSVSFMGVLRQGS